jgi:hypothetical protein
MEDMDSVEGAAPASLVTSFVLFLVMIQADTLDYSSFSLHHPLNCSCDTSFNILKTTTKEHV